MKPLFNSRYTSSFSFVAVLLLAEMTSRWLSPSLPIDPGKWPRVEIAQKLDQMRDMANKEERVEVLFVGSSMMAGGVDPVRFTEQSGLSSYNAAFAGPSMRTITPWTLDIVVPLLKPRFVVLGVQSRELSDNGPKNEVMYEKFVASPGYREAASNVALQIGGKLENLSEFLRNRRILREPSQLFAADSEEALATAAIRHEIGPRGRRNDAAGSYHNSRKFSQALLDKALIDYEVGGPELAALAKLETGLRRQGVELIIMNMPVTDDYWEAHEDPIGNRASYRSALEDVVDRAGIRLVDAEDAFPDAEEFRDPMHLDVAARISLADALAESWPELTDGAGGGFKVVCSAARACHLERSEWLASR
jgi:hypothetical protein